MRLLDEVLSHNDSMGINPTFYHFPTPGRGVKTLLLTLFLAARLAQIRYFYPGFDLPT
jgi:hypothetical protein